ncbi:hypothetical protein TNCV_3350661 [Trichonephila clavipes]|nr:hypothetical protein TNCV_3350661 [Trichonephila clavipes]
MFMIIWILFHGSRSRSRDRERKRSRSREASNGLEVETEKRIETDETGKEDSSLLTQWLVHPTSTSQVRDSNPGLGKVG